MNYINKGNRDILIFPLFENIDKIQSIRQKYDELANIIPPHITLAFPFSSDISNTILEEKIKSIVKDIKPFKITAKGIEIKKDTKVNTNYIFLNIVDGKNELLFLHQQIYSKVLKKEIPKDYKPHITLGNTNNPHEDILIKDKFECIIDTITIEQIGEDEESILVKNIKFGKRAK